MWTQIRHEPSSSRAAEIASSKSRALVGSIVNVGSARRSRRPSSCTGAPSAARASRSTAGSKPRRRPRSIISASSTSRATSGRPSRRATTARPRARPFRLGAGATTTRSPMATLRSRLRASRGPVPKNGSATKNFPRRCTTATRVPGGAAVGTTLTSVQRRRCAPRPRAPHPGSCADCPARRHWARFPPPRGRRRRRGCARWA